MVAESLGVLEKRRAQAEVIKPIYDVLVERLGKDEAQSIIATAIRAASIEEGRRFAAQEPETPNLASFSALLPLWRKSDALQIVPLKETGEAFDYNVTRCKYAEMYVEMGLAEIGHLLSCNRDASFCEGYSPLISLKRTQTIMQGADHCDFRYESVDPAI